MDNDASEIIKLTERIAKDPKSKLFVSLAEEYKKAGDGEMAISVLREGLKNNPGYVTAKSSLGKLLFESGDLPGSQTEFEEVVKAVPDNIMAQRKLGDIYTLQGRASDALTHYKLVLSINPRDEETKALVADLEAGRDIKARIAAPKIAAKEETSAKRGKSPVGTQAAGNTMTGRAESKSETEDLLSGPGVSAGEEEAEEVLFVEPLDAPSSSLEDALSSENLGFVSETETELAEPSLEAQLPPLEVPEEGEVLEMAEGPLGFEETTSASAPAESGKQSDDFTTDTLAELYITQGFFEKAVEIYERLVVDNPTNQGLKAKLAKVKAMAAGAAPMEPVEADKIELAAPHEFVTDQAMAVESDLGGELGLGEEFVPPSDQERILSRTEDSVKARGTSGEPPSTELDTTFEPVEYIPPDAVPRTKEADEKSGRIAAKESEPRTPGARTLAGRKETIDRLENWLHQIMKEK